jgi:hypothetical protein
LIAAECVGDGRWFIERSKRYAAEREVFEGDRPEQGVQFPIGCARQGGSGDLMRARRRAVRRGPALGRGHMAKYLAADASWGSQRRASDVRWFRFAESDIERDSARHACIRLRRSQNDPQLRGGTSSDCRDLLMPRPGRLAFVLCVGR